MKLNITPGPWATNADISFIYGDLNRVNGTMEDLICDPPNCEESYNNWKDNAAAIVTAVNNTYHKGINPEAVPEMLEAIECALSDITWLLRRVKEKDGNGSYQADTTIDKLIAVLQKATL